MNGSNFAELLTACWQEGSFPDDATDHVCTAFTERLARRISADTIAAWKADPPSHHAAIQRAVMALIKMDSVARDLARRLNVPQSVMPQSSRSQAKRPPNEPEPVTILFLAANPPNQTRLDLPREFDEIDTAIRKAKFSDRFKLYTQWAVRATTLQEYLQLYEPDILHFSGHGGGEEGLYFQGQSWSSSQPVASKSLARALALHRPKLRCVVLNACHTEEQASAIAQSIDCVIGTTESIGDIAASQFAYGFYHALANGIDVAQAFARGECQLDLIGRDVTDKLRLYSRCRVAFIEPSEQG